MEKKFIINGDAMEEKNNKREIYRKTYNKHVAIAGPV